MYNVSFHLNSCKKVYLLRCTIFIIQNIEDLFEEIYFVTYTSDLVNFMKPNDADDLFCKRQILTMHPLADRLSKLSIRYLGSDVTLYNTKVQNENSNDD